MRDCDVELMAVALLEQSMAAEIDVAALHALVDDMAPGEAAMLTGTVAGLWAGLAALHPDSARQLLDLARARALAPWEEPD